MVSCVPSRVNLAYKLPYSGNVWRGESLTNLANRPCFAKLKPSKLVITINNSLPDLLIRQTFFRKMVGKSRFTKLYRYTVCTE